MGELEKILAGHLVRRRALLPLAGDQGLQDARARALVALPCLHALRGLRRRAPQARRAAVARRDEGGRGSRTRSRAAFPAARRQVRPRETARTPRPHGARPDAAARRAYTRVLRRPSLTRTARRGHRSASHRNPRAVALLARGRARLPDPRPPVAHALRRRGAAHQPHHGARHLARQHAVRAGRAFDRPASARHGPRDRRDAAPARRRQLARRGRARSADHAAGRPPHGHGPGTGRARRRDRFLRHARRAEAVEDAQNAHGRISLREKARQQRQGVSGAGQESAEDRAARRRRAQPEGHRYPHSAAAAGVHHRRLGVGEIDAGAGRALRRAAKGERQADRNAGDVSRAARPRADRGCDHGGPDADRAHHALEPRELCRRLGCDSQHLRERAARERAQVHRRHVQLQLRQRPVPDLRRQRLRARRDAIPVGRVPALPGLQRQALPRRGARGRGGKKVDRRRARADRVRGARFLSRPPGGARGAQAVSRSGARASGRRRARVPARRPACADALRRRGAAAEARRASGRGVLEAEGSARLAVFVR